MKLVQTLVVRDEADIVDAQIAFHVNAGVDVILVSAPDGTKELLQQYVQAGHVQLFPGDEHALARMAAAELGADWVISNDHGEFWWPRGESLKEILAAIPKRYVAVQGLVRRFVPTEDGDAFFAERTVTRHSMQYSADTPPAESLKAVHRAGDAVGVPLRAWYPIEILRFPPADAQPLGEEARERGLADGSLVLDTRLRDALRALRPADSGGPSRFALPGAGARAFEFPTPDVVDDAAYAVECAAVGEVSLEELERRIDELEAQLTRLERRFWTRVSGRVSRLTRSPGRPEAPS